MKEIAALCREFKRNYDGSSREDQQRLNVKLALLGVHGIMVLVTYGVLYATVRAYCEQKGLSPMIAPTFLVLAMLLSYKGLSFLCRKLMEQQAER